MEQIVHVTFNTGDPGTPGQWNFVPAEMTLEPDRRVIHYQLNRDGSSADWSFQRVAVCENVPHKKSFKTGNSAGDLMEFDDLAARVEEFTGDSIRIGFAGNLKADMKLGVEIEIGKAGEEPQLSRDPQITVKRDDDPPPIGSGD